MPLRDELYDVTEVRDDEGRWLVVTGREVERQYGPYPDTANLDHERIVIFRRWRDRAKERGGYAVIHTREQWRVVLPVEKEEG